MCGRACRFRNTRYSTAAPGSVHDSVIEVAVPPLQVVRHNDGMEGQATNEPRRPAVGLVAWLLLGIPAGAGTACFLWMSVMGTDSFFHRLRYPLVDGGSYDLLNTTLVGIVALLLGITAAGFFAEQGPGFSRRRSASIWSS